MLVTPFLTGLALGASLIIAIGAQNAFVLRQGLLREHVFAVCLICALSDAILIAIGVAGVGTFIENSPSLLIAIRVGGAAFLIWYAALALKRALKPDGLKAAKEGADGLLKAVTICLMLTFLNPHVYLDTVLLLGGLSTQFPGEGKFIFGAGAVASSFLWFFSLGYGARLLVPLFEKPLAWRILDFLIAAVMLLIAISLLSPFVA